MFLERTAFPVMKALLTHAAFEEGTPWSFPSLPPNEIALFLYVWDSRDMLSIGRHLADRELAIVALLGGFWPPSAEIGDSAGDVIIRMTAWVRKSRAAHGRLHNALEKFLAGVAPKPKAARYFVRLSASPILDGDWLTFRAATDSIGFETFEAAKSFIEERASDATVTEMGPGSWWFIWDDSGHGLLGSVELGFLPEQKKRPGVPD